MPKVAIIGAGSIVFCKTLILDILATRGLENTEFALMAPSTTRTSQVEAFINRVIQANGLPARVWVTTDRREALQGAAGGCLAAGRYELRLTVDGGGKVIRVELLASPDGASRRCAEQALAGLAVGSRPSGSGNGVWTATLRIVR